MIAAIKAETIVKAGLMSCINYQDRNGNEALMSKRLGYNNSLIDLR